MRFDVYHHVDVENHFDQSFVDLIVSHFEALQAQGEKIMATQEEAAAQLTAATATLAKVATETGTLLTKIQELQDVIATAGNVTPELQAAVDGVVAQATAVDALVPDA